MATVEQVKNVTRRMSEEKATMLAREAVELSRAGYKDEASRRLRAAAALGPENIDVQSAFLAIHNEESRSPLLDLCRKYALYHDAKSGREAIKYLRSDEAPNAANSALECIQLLLESVSTTLDVSQDAIIAELSNRSVIVRRYLARELKASTTEFFDNLYDRGDDAANCLRSIVLDQSLWEDESSRLHVEDELFLLFLAKLMESGHDHDGRALKGIALLLIADTQRLHTFVDEDGFDALLCSLDYRLPPEVRGQATLVLSKLLEVSEATGQQYFAKFVTDHVAKAKGDDLILAFSAAAQFFPLASAVTAQLFLTEGFLPSVLPLLERNKTTTHVHGTFLALLNATCIDAGCRQAIAQHCSPWLSHKVSNGIDKQPSMAATVLAKLRTSGTKPSGQDQRAANTANDDDVSELVDLFTKTLSLEEGRNVSDSIEGLAYTSLKPEVKEKLANDRAFLKHLLQALEDNSAVPEIVVGALSIVFNLTHYPPNLSEEQKKISQLKAYANASKPGDSSPLEDEDHIRNRCTALVDANLMPTLVKINRTKSNSTSQLTDQILLSLSRNPKDRGKLAQQGAVKLLIQHAQKALQKQQAAAKALTASTDGPTPPSPSPSSSVPATDASHALARLLISLNPAHVFTTSTPHITDAVPALVSLLHNASANASPLAASSDNQSQDRLPTFESLLALTNLASHPSGQAAEIIVRLAFPQIEDLLLHDHYHLRRAAVELLCNLCVCDVGAGKFGDGSARAKGRLRVLLALGDVDDIPTRQAAGGALAVLSEREAVAKGILAARGGSGRNADASEKEEAWGVQRVLGLIADEEDQGVVVRGLVVLGNLCEADGGLDIVKGQNAAEVVKAALKKTRDEQVLEVGVQVLKRLMGAT
ncbi:Ring assembly protein 3 [Cyphellophora attinorum]|uniref:Ring assembly protein 3 n=1 Tax=Cyphellophora attinorum TaxID=1664694 RepID=A0A0N1H2K3_9EURO|nr:Ring assembly protein 3 [Phialophora attinorum]KPI35495.1 Ring assembly protein 3 [Phialophora attinorum]